MSDIQPTTEPSVTASLPASTTEIPIPTEAAPSKKSRRNLFLITGCVLSLFLCAGLFMVIFGTAMIKVKTEWPKVESTIEEFMNLMVDKDADNAYSLFSNRSKRNVKLADLENFLDGNNYVLFSGYRDAAITNLNLTSTINPDPDMPQGAVAEVLGTVSYDDGFTGEFNAVLEKEGAEWRLFSINIVVPPDKFRSNP